MPRADAPDRPAVVGLAAFAALGLSDGLLGAAWPAIRDTLSQPVGALAELQLLASAGFFCSAVAAARLRLRLGAGRYLALGAAASTAALAGFVVSPAWAGLLAAMLVLGAGSAVVDVGFNAHAALNFTQGLTNALHAVYGIGITVGPLVVAGALAAGSWRLGYGVSLGVDALLAAAIWSLRRRFPTAPPARWAAVPAPSARRALGVLMPAAFFVVTGLEAAVGSWAPSVLVDDRGLSEGAGAAWVAAFWGAFTAARVALAAAGSRLPPERTLRGGTGLALAGLAVFWADPGGAGTAGLPLAGIGLAGLFPALVVLTPLRLGADRAAAAVGRQLAAGTAGVAALVGLAGAVAQLAGTGAVAPYLVAVAVLLVALEAAVARAGA